MRILVAYILSKENVDKYLDLIRDNWKYCESIYGKQYYFEEGFTLPESSNSSSEQGNSTEKQETEVINFLNENNESELLAVLAHEIGHLKHKKDKYDYFKYFIFIVILFLCQIYPSAFCCPNSKSPT
mgnify:CR=1 FL=1